MALCLHRRSLCSGNGGSRMGDSRTRLVLYNLCCPDIDDSVAEPLLPPKDPLFPPELVENDDLGEIVSCYLGLNPRILKISVHVIKAE